MYELLLVNEKSERLTHSRSVCVTSRLSQTSDLDQVVFTISPTESVAVNVVVFSFLSLSTLWDTVMQKR